MLDVLFGRRRAGASADRGWITNRIRALAGPVVDEDLALTYSALWSGTRLLSESAAGLPLFTYRRKGDDERTHAVELPVYDLLHSMPNPSMGSMAFRVGRHQHQILWGNGFAEIERAGTGPDAPVVALWPIHPSRVKCVEPADRLAKEWSYKVRNNNNTWTPFRSHEVLHIPGALSEDGVWGKSVVAYGRESIGFGLGVERHGASHFAGGAQPRGIVYGPGMNDPEARREFRSEWKEMHGSPDSGEIAILPIEAKYEKISLAPEDSQFLGTRGFNIDEIARWLRVPPHLLYSLNKATYGSIEVQSIEFVIYSLLPWLRMAEGQYSLKLLTPAERGSVFIEHQLSGLLRGDIQARMNAYRTAIMIGVMTINECRRLENLNGIGPAGDANYVPLNMTTAERMMQGLDQPTGGAGLGSDQSGAEPDPAKAFDGWTRKLGKAKRQSIQQQLKQLRQEIKQLAAPVESAAEANRAAARAVLADVLARMFTKEARAAGRIVEGKGELEPHLAEWYGKHEATLVQALAPAVQVLSCAGVKASAAELAGRLTADSRAALRAAYDSESREAMARRLAAWPTERAADVAGRILTGGF